MMRLISSILCALCVLGGLPTAQAASARSQNFVVTAPTQEWAEKIAERAEHYRREHAVAWLGAELPPWAAPCPITAQIGEQLGNGGATSYLAVGGEVHGWSMQIQGTPERIVDAVLAHEVMHTVLASHFRVAAERLPLWVNEGICTSVEHESEQAKQSRALVEALSTGRSISFSALLRMQSYPSDPMPLYAQGWSLTSFLVAHGGRAHLIDTIAEGLQTDNWQAVVCRRYAYQDLRELQNTWLEWVKAGSPRPDHYNAYRVPIFQRWFPQQRTWQACENGQCQVMPARPSYQAPQQQSLVPVPKYVPSTPAPTPGPASQIPPATYGQGTKDVTPPIDCVTHDELDEGLARVRQSLEAYVEEREKTPQAPAPQPPNPPQQQTALAERFTDWLPYLLGLAGIAVSPRIVLAFKGLVYAWRVGGRVRERRKQRRTKSSGSEVPPSGGFHRSSLRA